MQTNPNPEVPLGEGEEFFQGDGHDTELKDLDKAGDDLSGQPAHTPKKERPKLKSYAEMTKAYWYQFIDPKMWRTMPIFLVIGLAFWCLGFIPNYEDCMLSQSIFAIIGGVLLGTIPKVKEWIHSDFTKTGVNFSKQMFMRLAVILYGFRTKLTDIGDVGWGGALSAILMVFLTFILGSIIGIKVLKLAKEQSQVIACGFSICGIAAIMSASGIVNASSADVSLACIFVIVGGFLDIILYPILYTAKDDLFHGDRNFGIAAGISIKEIAHTVSVGMSCSDTVSRYAMIVKMFKVLLLPFLLIGIAFVVPLFSRNKEHLDNEDDEDAEEYNTCSYKALDFFNKVTIPYFAFIFIITTIINSYTNISQKAHDILNEIIIIALSVSMFCVGVTTDLKELLKASGWRPLVFAGGLYLWVFLFGWLLEYAFHNV